MRTFIIILIMLAAVGGIGFFLLGDAPEAKAPTTESEEETSMSSDTENDAKVDGTGSETNMNETNGTDVGAEFPRLDGELPPEETADDNDTSYAAIVTYTDGGFSPRTVTIQTGETVRFVNESSRGMWIGSNNHPTHTLYPETSADDCLGSSFDQCTSSSAGTFWEYTFTASGEWGYHNHIRSSHGGTVIVE